MDVHAEYLMRIPSLRIIFENNILSKTGFSSERQKFIIFNLLFFMMGLFVLGLRTERRTRMNECSGLCNVHWNGSVIVGASNY